MPTPPGDELTMPTPPGGELTMPTPPGGDAADRFICPVRHPGLATRRGIRQPVAFRRPSSRQDAFSRDSKIA
jgi:hypothetical protein